MISGDPQILVTGRHFTGHGLRAIGSVLQELLDSAESEVQILAYVLSEWAGPLLQSLERGLERGVSTTIVVNRLEQQPAELIETFTKMRRAYGHAQILSFAPDDGSRLHAKVVVVDRKRAIIGSANLTWGGMVANHEVGVLVEGQPAWMMGDFIARLVAELRAGMG